MQIWRVLESKRGELFLPSLIWHLLRTASIAEAEEDAPYTTSRRRKEVNSWRIWLRIVLRLSITVILILILLMLLILLLLLVVVVVVVVIIIIIIPASICCCCKVVESFCPWLGHKPATDGHHNRTYLWDYIGRLLAVGENDYRVKIGCRTYTILFE